MKIASILLALAACAVATPTTPGFGSYFDEVYDDINSPAPLNEPAANRYRLSVQNLNDEKAQKIQRNIDTADYQRVMAGKAYNDIERISEGPRTPEAIEQMNDAVKVLNTAVEYTREAEREVLDAQVAVDIPLKQNERLYRDPRMAQAADVTSELAQEAVDAKNRADAISEKFLVQELVNEIASESTQPSTQPSTEKPTVDTSSIDQSSVEKPIADAPSKPKTMMDTIKENPIRTAAGSVASLALAAAAIYAVNALISHRRIRPAMNATSATIPNPISAH